MKQCHLGVGRINNGRRLNGLILGVLAALGIILGVLSAHCLLVLVLRLALALALLAPPQRCCPAPASAGSAACSAPLRTCRTQVSTYLHIFTSTKNSLAGAEE